MEDLTIMDISILVGLLAAIGTIVGVFIKLGRDNKSLSRDHSDLKSDHQMIHSSLKDNYSKLISTNEKSSNQLMYSQEKIVTNLHSVQKTTEKIDYMIETERQDRMFKESNLTFNQQSIQQSLTTLNGVVDELKTVNAKNVELSTQNKQLILENKELLNDNKRLTEKVRQLTPNHDRGMER